MAAPFRSCDHCDKPAVVHNTVIVGNKMTEVHLCEEHAKQMQIHIVGAAPIKQILGQLGAAPPSRPRGPSCPECGHTFADFKSSGLIGCAACYDAFIATIGPIVERAHAGATQHIGRTPPRVGDAPQRAAVLQRLLKELEEAVVAEQYERAAILRDKVRQMRTEVPGGADAAGAGAGAGGAAGASGDEGAR